MHVRFSDEASGDLQRIRDYIAGRNPTAAQRVVDTILITAYQLESFPFLGRHGRVPSTREISIPKYPYFIVYTLPDEYHIDIEAIFHTSQLYPSEKDFYYVE